MRQLTYDSAPLTFSDHRPVYATFDCAVSIVDESRRESISQELYARRKHDIGDTTAHIGDVDDSEDEDLVGYDSIEPGLPPASSDRQKWWLDNHQPARVEISGPNTQPGHKAVLNPNRPSNPFGRSDEPDWVSVRRGSPASSTATDTTNMAAGRKLPPAVDPSLLAASIDPMKKANDAIPRKPVGESAEAPPPPPPRRSGTDSSQVPPSTARRGSSASSQASGLSNGKPPPPIARKPAFLSMANTGPSTVSSAQPALPARSNTITAISSGSPSGTQPVATPARAGAAADAAPKLPTRPVPDRSNVDLLGSLGETKEDVGGWQILQPSK